MARFASFHQTKIKNNGRKGREYDEAEMYLRKSYTNENQTKQAQVIRWGSPMYRIEKCEPWKSGLEDKSSQKKKRWTIEHIRTENGSEWSRMEMKWFLFSLFKWCNNQRIMGNTQCVNSQGALNRVKEFLFWSIWSGFILRIHEAGGLILLLVQKANKYVKTVTNSRWLSVLTWRTILTYRNQYNSIHVRNTMIKMKNKCKMKWEEKRNRI